MGTRIGIVLLSTMMRSRHRLLSGSVDNSVAYMDRNRSSVAAAGFEIESAVNHECDHVHRTLKVLAPEQSQFLGTWYAHAAVQGRVII